MKLAILEAETDELRSFLRANPDAKASSAIATVEVVRAVRIVDDALLGKAFAVCAGLDLITVTDELLAEARDVAPHVLRTLDAVHLASAKRIARAGLTAFVAYDDRLLEAAAAAGLPTRSPGR